MGFNLNDNYTHDDWETLSYKKGSITIDFTYTLGLEKLESITVDIEEVTNLTFSRNAFILLDSLINRN